MNSPVVSVQQLRFVNRAITSNAKALNVKAKATKYELKAKAKALTSLLRLQTFVNSIHSYSSVHVSVDVPKKHKIILEINISNIHLVHGFP